MAMRKPVIVGIDPLRPDPAPMAVGVALARLTGAPLVAAASHVRDTIADAMSGGIVEGDLRANAQSVLDDLTAGGLDAERVVVPGLSAAHALHDLAAERGAGLIVVGSSHRGRIGRIAPGTTAERLLHGASCPVAVAPAGLATGWAPRRVGVGYVALEEAEHALTAASALAKLSGGPLEAVTAVSPRQWERGAAVPAYGTGGLDAARETAQRSLTRALEGAGHPSTEGHVFVGEPVDALVALSERSDVVLCGSRGYGPFRSVLLGGVGHGLLRDAHCPVIVIPRGEGGAIAALAAARETAPA
jgi:nucleotide-binding universal stress UspA family protein